MDANGVKIQIDSKLEVIGSTIASFLRADEGKIRRRLKGLNYYVYDNYYLQQSRLRNIELKKIAMEYSSEVFDDLDASDSIKSELTEQLSNILISSLSLDPLAMKPIVDDFVSKEIFKSCKAMIANNIDFALTSFNKDYETKEIISKIDSGEYHHKTVEDKSDQIKSQLIRELFNVEVKERLNIDWLWKSLLAFSITDEELTNASTEFKERIKNSRLKAYRFLGVDGKNLQECVNNAQRRGIIINKSIVDRMESEYNTRFVKNCASTLRLYTNSIEIMDDLKEKGFVVDDSNLVFLFNNPSIYGVNFQVFGRGGSASYVIFSNSEVMYTSEFNDTCVHEIIHYLGGIDSLNNKRGLLFDDNKIYLDLEEAYVNAVSKKIKDRLVKSVGNIVEPSKEEDYSNYYDHTLKYMEFVLKHYLKQLSEIHLSSNMSLKEANIKMPYDLIAKSVSRIMNCKKQDVEKYTEEEIELLKQNMKKNKRS